MRTSSSVLALLHWVVVVLLGVSACGDVTSVLDSAVKVMALLPDVLRSAFSGW